MVLLYSILGAFARRIYGGWLEAYKIIKNRGVQTVLMMSLFLTIYLPRYKWYIAIIITAWLQFQFWSRGHGCAFDLGRGGVPDETLIKRYNERWYHIPCDWLSNKFGFKQYGKIYDFVYMTLRYTCPMIPMMLFDWKHILIGLSISVIYALCWRYYESKYWRYDTNFCGNATNLAEIISGAVVYGGCYLLC
jgi:hypothetical protein